MTKEQIAGISRIIGVSVDSISSMDEKIQNSMTAILETISVKSDEDRKAVFDALDELWQRGSILNELAEVAKSTGIPLPTLKSLDYETQKTIVYEFMMDSSQTERFYELTNKALAVAELGKIADLTGISMHELKSLPTEIQEKICGIYAMEYDSGSTNAGLIDSIREMIL